MAVSVYNLMSDLQATSIAGKAKSFSQYLKKLQARTSRELQSKFVNAFNENNEKLNSYLNLTSGNPSNNLFKAVRKSDPGQIGGLSHGRIQTTYQRVGQLSVKQRVAYTVALLVYKCLHGVGPPYFKSTALYSAPTPCTNPTCVQ